MAIDMKKTGMWIVLCVMGLLLVFAGQYRVTKEYTATSGSGNLSAKKAEEKAQPTVSTDVSKKVYLTFDDGPGSLTEQYLDILKKHGIHATFFLIGSQAEENPELVEREISEGHELGIHSYSHESGKIYQSADACYQDVCQVRDLLWEKFGYRAKVWRFPWGSANSYLSWFKKDVVDRLYQENLEYVDWNVSGEDSVGSPTVASILENVKKDAFKVNDPVILLHDSACNQATLESLEQIISLFESQGYTFETISERSQRCHFGEYY
jgi:peptidoglycan/xylan/chitin deacetylase (PgdA/CDA1 family)